MVWQQGALLHWLLLGEEGLTPLSTHMSLFLLLYSDRVVLRSNTANRAKYGGINNLPLLHVAWDGGILCELELSFCGRNHLYLCITCIMEDVGKLMVVTWSFMIQEGYLATQLEITLDILEMKLWCSAYITHCSKWGYLPCADAIGRGKNCPSIYFCICLRTSNNFSVEDCNIPKFSHVYLEY